MKHKFDDPIPYAVAEYIEELEAERDRLRDLVALNGRRVLELREGLNRLSKAWTTEPFDVALFDRLLGEAVNRAFEGSARGRTEA